MRKYSPIIVIFVLCLIFPDRTFGAEVGISYGKDIRIQRLCSPDVETHQLELELKMPVKRWVDINWLSIGIVVNKMWSDTYPGHMIDDVYFEGRDHSLIFALRLTARKMVTENIFLEGYGGLGWMTPKDQPEIGENQTLGNFGGHIGYNFNVFSLICGVEHWSDWRTHRDKGHNLNYVGIRIPFGKKGKR